MPSGKPLRKIEVKGDFHRGISVLRIHCDSAKQMKYYILKENDDVEFINTRNARGGASKGGRGGAPTPCWAFRF